MRIQLFVLASVAFFVSCDVSEFLCVAFNSSASSESYHNTFHTAGNVMTQRLASNVSCDVTEGSLACFGFVQNVTHNNTVLAIPNVLKGCWSNHNECLNKSECIAAYYDNGNYFCCCDAPLCNAKMTLTSDPPKSAAGGKSPLTRLPNEAFNGRQGSSSIKVILISLLPLLGIAVAIVVLFLSWRVCRGRIRGESLSSNASIESKEAPLLPSRSTPTPSMDLAALLKHIELLEVKATRHFGGCVRRAKLENEIVAVKIFSAQEKQSWEKERDLYTLSSLKHGHPNVLGFVAALKRDVFEGGSKGLEYWLVTEYQELGCLHDFLKSHTVSWTDAILIMMSACQGLVFLHSRNYDELNYSCLKGRKLSIAHRDIKSRNILLKNDMTACIADFGLALVLDGKTGNTHSQAGTLRYMSPEVLDGSINFSSESFLKIDMYAFALVLWEVLSRAHAQGVDAAQIYKLPFEERVGLNVSLEDMKQTVMDDRLRPPIRKEWVEHEGINSVVQVMEEMWDQDPDARLSAVTVYHRLLPLTEDERDRPTSTRRPYFDTGRTLVSYSERSAPAAEETNYCRVDVFQTESLLSPKGGDGFVKNSSTEGVAGGLSVDADDDYLVPPLNFSKTARLFDCGRSGAPFAGPVANGYLLNGPDGAPEKTRAARACPYPGKNYYPPNMTPFGSSCDSKSPLPSQFAYSPPIDSSALERPALATTDRAELVAAARSGISNRISSPAV